MFKGNMMLVHQDERRAISECNLPSGSIKGFRVTSDKLPLGNHYHMRTTEVFLITEGTGTVVSQLVDKEGKPIGDIEYTTVKEGDVVQVEPYTAHTFFLSPGSKMICMADQPFDQNDQDMHKHELTQK